MDIDRLIARLWVGILVVALISVIAACMTGGIDFYHADV